MMISRVKFYYDWFTKTSSENAIKIMKIKIIIFGLLLSVKAHVINDGIPM